MGGGLKQDKSAIKGDRRAAQKKKSGGRVKDTQQSVRGKMFNLKKRRHGGRRESKKKRRRRSRSPQTKLCLRNISLPLF